MVDNDDINRGNTPSRSSGEAEAPVADDACAPLGPQPAVDAQHPPVEGDAVLASLGDPERAGFVSDKLLCSAFENSQGQRRAVFANECRLLAMIEHRRLWRCEGHASIYGWLRHHYGYSDAECRIRVTIARAHLVMPDIVDALSAGDLPIAHAELLAKAVTDCTSDPRVDRCLFERELGFWLNETGRDYRDFRTRIEEWSTRLRIDQTLADEDRKHDSRYCKIRHRRDHMVSIEALLDAEAGSKVIEVFGQLAGQAFDNDWADAERIHGDQTNSALLTRTDQQRQADALVEMAELAHTNPNSGFSRDPLITILIDKHTYTDAMIRLGIFPKSARLPDEHLTPTQRWCRTNTGVPIHPMIAAQATIVGKVRFTMVDSLMRPLKSSSQQRLFTGAMREVIMATRPTCYWPGCNRPVNECQADHYDEHHTGGPTALTNGVPICGKHNRYKTTHDYRPQQTRRGNWTLPRRSSRVSGQQQQLGISEVRTHQPGLAVIPSMNLVGESSLPPRNSPIYAGL